MLLPFVQLEFAHSIGIPPGAYPVLDADTLLVEVVPGQAAGRRRRLGAGAAPPWPPPEVALVVATVVLASEPIANADTAAGSELLAAWERDYARQRLLLDRALAIVNRGVRAYRAAALDPYAIEVMELDPRAIRFGLGAPGAIGAGQWLQAFTMQIDAPASDPRSVEELRIGASVGAVLAGRAVVFEAEDLALRALLELRHGRLRAAGALARASVEVLKQELRGSLTDEQLQRVAAVAGDDPELLEATALHVLETAAAFRGEQLRADEAIRAPV
ncbi:MAG: hypothetical protein ACYDHH_04430 [Solirubrobacteraceae bacterium]